MKQPINVLHLLGTAMPEGHGVAKFVAELEQNLNPQYKLHAWFLKSDGSLVDKLSSAGAHARWVDWKHGSRDPMGAFRFWRQLRSEQFALIHQHWGARSIRQLARATTGAKIIVHLHGQLLPPDESDDDPVSVRGADAILAVSKAIASQIPRRRVHVVYSGVRTSSEPIRMRSNQYPVMIGTACRLIEAKGVRDLIIAFSQLKEEFPGVRLEVAGDGPERNELLRIAREHGVSEQVNFLGWIDDLRPVLRTWDIFALPSYDEGLPVVILEAMSEGLPVVATNVGGMPELVEDGRTGYVVAPGNIDTLCTALRRLATSSQLRIQQGDQGRQRAETKFSVQQMAAEIESIYGSLLSPQ